MTLLPIMQDIDSTILTNTRMDQRYFGIVPALMGIE
jgi:hypothetical protein